MLARPFISNVDSILIVMASEPSPDFMLADKLIAMCIKQDIKPLLCINKLDILSAEFTQNVRKSYGGVCGIIELSAKNGINISCLKELLKGKFTALAGQSAVGKTSILNALLPHLNCETGGLSLKVMRGRHTTRHTEIFLLDGGGYIADTPGFSMLEFDGIPCKELNLYYPEFEKYLPCCRFRGCTHINEPDCAVKKAVGEGALDDERYSRYKRLYEELKTNKIKY